jgi:hypothetical protein
MATKKTTTTPVTEPEPATATAPVNEAPVNEAPVNTNDLNIADLKNLAMIIDIASSRGAFRANEMATIGLVYNKLQGFLAKVSPAPAPTVGQDGAGPAPMPTATENK